MQSHPAGGDYLRGIGDRRRQREFRVVMVRWQQIGLASVEPGLDCAALAPRTIPVAAGFEGDLVDAASLTAQHASNLRRTSALFDGRHSPELTRAQVDSLGLTPGWPELKDDVCNFQGCALRGVELRGGQTVERTDHLA